MYKCSQRHYHVIMHEQIIFLLLRLGLYETPTIAKYLQRLSDHDLDRKFIVEIIVLD